MIEEGTLAPDFESASDPGSACDSGPARRTRCPLLEGLASWPSSQGAAGGPGRAMEPALTEGWRPLEPEALQGIIMLARDAEACLAAAVAERAKKL